MNYDRLEKRVIARSDKTLDGVVYARRRENNFMTMIVVLCLSDLLFFFLHKAGLTKFVSYICMLSFIYLGLLFILTKRAGIGICYKSIIYCKYSNLLFRELSTEEIILDKIQTLDVKKIGPRISVKMAYVNELGKLTEASFVFASFVLSKYRKRYEKSAKIIYDRLVELQKVLDKGDF